MRKITPKDLYEIFPIGSVSQKTECEFIAQKIVLFLFKYYGNTWIKLTWDQYKSFLPVELHKLIHSDPAVAKSQKEWFDRVIDYTVSYETAKLFCKEWNLDNTEDGTI